MTPQQRAEIRAAARETALRILRTAGRPPQELLDRAAALLRPTSPCTQKKAS